MTVAVTQYDQINCDSPECGAFYQADGFYCYSAETRQQAKKLGWQVNVMDHSRRHMLTRRKPRLDFCPKHVGEKRR